MCPIFVPPVPLYSLDHTIKTSLFSIINTGDVAMETDVF